jgi:hypothetical protein
MELVFILPPNPDLLTSWKIDILPSGGILYRLELSE